MAAYQYTRLSQYGTMAGNQTWSVGLAVQHSQAQPPSGTQLDAWLTALDTALKLWWTQASSLQSFNSAAIKYIGARAYSYAINSKTAINQAEHPFTTALLGTNGVGSLPLQTSIVSSTLSGFPGRSHRGRRYLPVTATTLASNQMQTSGVDGLVSAEVTLMNTINTTTLGTGTGTCVIANKKDFPDVIRSVQIDSEPDVQRRRADKIVATYFKKTSLT